MSAIVAVLGVEIRKNSEKCGVPLSGNLHSHLVITTARYFEDGLDLARLTVRLVRAEDERAQAGAFRKIGDDCLVGCALFPDAILRRGGSLAHYADVGRTAYDSAGLTEAAYGFGLMLDVLSAFREGEDRDLLALARAGSVVAKGLTKGQVVVPFTGRPRARF